MSPTHVFTDGHCLSHQDLNDMPWLFKGKGDIQFDVYRNMRNATKYVCTWLVATLVGSYSVLCVYKLLCCKHVLIPLFSSGLIGRSSLLTLTYCGSTTSQPRPRSRASWRGSTARSGRPSSSPTSEPFSSTSQWKMCFWMSSTLTSHFATPPHNTTQVVDSTLCNFY